MKLYRCMIYDAARGTLFSWHSSRREAEQILRREQRARGEEACGPEGVNAVEIPTDRAGLLAWLNAHFNSDNG